ncbi:MAG: hypothetical protein H6732_06335 [Alphaproteobacteria bacterium]|nr:hypothetical protein [Alphaproteobacteria bacterium]
MKRATMKGVAVLLAWGCAPAPDGDDDTDAVAVDTDPVPLGDPPGWVAPDAPGPYGVGVVTLTWTHPELGELRAELWYPATPETDAPRATYDQDILSFPSDVAVREAPPDRRGGPYPLVAFSHGFGGIRFQSFFLTEHLASHGFVVIAPDHPMSSLVDLRPSKAAEAAARRPGQLSAAVDLLDTAPVAGLEVDTSRFAAVGHSFGGWTSLVVGGGVVHAEAVEEVCATLDPTGCNFFEGQELPLEEVAKHAQPDPRAQVTVALAPGVWYAFGTEGEGLQSVRRPLVLGGTRDGDLPYAKEILPTYEALGAGKALGSLQDAGHWAFSDLCRILPVADCAGEAKGFMEPERTQAITREKVLAWVRVGLLDEGRDAPWLAGAEDLAWEVGE